jgi:hypothetical protein
MRQPSALDQMAGVPHVPATKNDKLHHDVPLVIAGLLICWYATAPPAVMKEVLF